MKEYVGSGGVIGIVGIVLISLLFIGLNNLKPVFASAPSGLPASIATSSTRIVGPQENKVLFATSTFACTSRVISTAGESIKLDFSSTGSSTPNVVAGLVQTASTTIAYDGGIYGCGRVVGYGYASSTVTLIDLR